MTQISSEMIVKQALTLIDNEGSAFSMRQLGKALGVDAKAIYYYFPAKEKLIDAVVRLALTDMSLPESDDMPWSEQLRILAREYYKLAVKHPHLIPYMVRVDGSMPAVFTVVERIVKALSKTPLEPTSIVQIIDLFMGFLPSFAIEATDIELDESAFLVHLRSLPLAEYPATAQLVNRLRDSDIVEDIELQINIVIWGIETLIEPGVKQSKKGR